MWWLRDVKDSDKVALLLLYSGLAVTMIGTAATILVALFVHVEGAVDRLIVVVGVLTSQGTGLVTAAMGMLRLQSKSGGDGKPPTAT